jgi:hypothetical protein
MQLNIKYLCFCSNLGVLLLLGNIIYSNKHLIPLNVMLKLFESILLDEIALTQQAKQICAPSLVGYLILT